MRTWSLIIIISGSSIRTVEFESGGSEKVLIQSFASNHAEMEGLETLLLVMWRKLYLIVLINPSLEDHPF